MNYTVQWVTHCNELDNAMNYTMQWITQYNELHNAMNYAMCTKLNPTQHSHHNNMSGSQPGDQIKRKAHAPE